jgi:hypothetical protein
MLCALKMQKIINIELIPLSSINSFEHKNKIKFDLFMINYHIHASQLQISALYTSIAPTSTPRDLTTTM